MNRDGPSLTTQMRIGELSISTCPPRFKLSSPKEELWMLLEQCHPTSPDPSGLVCSKPASEVFSSSSSIAQCTFLWAKLMHSWKLTARLQPQMVKTKEFLLASGCILWAIHEIVAVGESFPHHKPGPPWLSSVRQPHKTLQDTHPVCP